MGGIGAFISPGRDLARAVRVALADRLGFDAA
jgi:hypothetical protein